LPPAVQAVACDFAQAGDGACALQQKYIPRRTQAVAQAVALLVVALAVREVAAHQA